MKVRVVALLAVIVCCLSLPCGAVEELDGDIVVKAQKRSGEILVDVYFWVPATRQETWEVLTDFDHMAQFVSNVRSSKVIQRSGETVQISQSGKTRHGPFSFSFESVREIDMHPYDSIDSHVLSGTMQKSDGSTRLTTERNGTGVTFHSESIPGTWVPPLVGTALIENEIRSQFQDMRKEILRRKNAQ